ncbi:hypothetical protein Pint_31551 [Pistacia integerrima]|uniref:Uncharacterized protein n=1 Tax=Pistacia integerrima TaxID=434235 RepID=A0ACC0XS74_9ROSI|nr:hypothetical protein Pint_31551 [Pistacia integerrima]
MLGFSSNAFAIGTTFLLCKVTFAMRESSLAQSTQMIRFAGVTYDLHTQSLPQFGQGGLCFILGSL